MSPGVRRVVALIVSVAVALFIKQLLAHLANQVAPLPATIDLSSKAQVQVAFERGEVATSYLVLIVSGWLLGAFGGGTVVSRIGRSRGPLVLFAMVFTAVTVLDLSMMWHPMWMWLTGVLGVPLFALAAGGESITVR